MKNVVVPSQYLQIALDLARRIANGELEEGKRLYGRSVMASEYNVSPETIRRSLHLLADMKVVEIKPQSGITVLSADSAKRYIAHFEESADTKALRGQLQTLMDEYMQLHQRMSATIKAFSKSKETLATSGEPLPNYEITIPEESCVVGKSIGELQFWQSTGATVIAIRRGHTVILSPGPYAELYPGDVIVVVGSAESAEAVHRLVLEREAL